MLTPKQNECLCFIKDYIERYSFAPTFDIIRNGLNLKSKSGVHRLVSALEERRFIRRLHGRTRAIDIIKEPEVYARRVDDNQKDIIAAFRKLGYSVRDTSRLGEGFPDICCGKAGRTYIFEIKDGKKPPSARKLTPAEQKFKNEWRGQYTVIESVDDVLAFDRGMKWA